MSSWKDVMFGYYQRLQIAVAIAKMFIKIKKAFPKEYDVKEVRDSLCNGEVHFGDKINIVGTFSEYLPFIDPKIFLGGATKSLFPRTARLKAINDTYCGALFRQDQADAFASEVLPIFYSLDSRMLEHYTGEMLNLECQIIQVPAQYRDIINQNSYFAFEKEEGLLIPFGLKVLNVEPYGLVDEFKINMWLLGNLSPAPHLRKLKKQCCSNCQNLFSYMSIDPVEFPFDYACMANTRDANMPKEVVNALNRFMTLEKEGKAYIVFPDIFRQFEVFYPSVDILDENQRNHGKNILLGAIQENMELYFPYVVNTNVVMPKKSTLKVDFQYDQLNTITSQTFDPSDVPKWECPHYTPDPQKIKKLKTEDEEVTKKRFKLKKAY